MSATSIGWVKEDNIVYIFCQKRAKTMVEHNGSKAKRPS
jgi:hypothetical protein